jgi:hypothetical protein
MELTPFGRAVLIEDTYLKERVTQWIAHFNMCRPNGGADVWYQTFCKGFRSLGARFSKLELEKYLAAVYGTGAGDTIGPLFGMYTEEAAFALCGVLEFGKNGTKITRKPAPTLNELAVPYSAWILQLIKDHFPKKGQVTVTQLDEVAGLCSIPGWDTQDFERALSLIERRNFIHIDRQMTPWILRPSADADELWGGIYTDLI